MVFRWRPGLILAIKLLLNFFELYSECFELHNYEPSWRKGYARQRRHSKMAVRRHLGFYRTGNSAIRSADPENPSQTWSGSDAPFAWYSTFLNYNVTLKLGFEVTQGRRKRHHYIGRPEKPDPRRSKHHADRQTGWDVLAIIVYPWWPSPLGWSR